MLMLPSPHSPSHKEAVLSWKHINTFLHRSIQLELYSASHQQGRLRLDQSLWQHLPDRAGVASAVSALGANIVQARCHFS